MHNQICCALPSEWIPRKIKIRKHHVNAKREKTDVHSRSATKRLLANCCYDGLPFPNIKTYKCEKILHTSEDIHCNTAKHLNENDHKSICSRFTSKQTFTSRRCQHCLQRDCTSQFLKPRKNIQKFKQ